MEYEPPCFGTRDIQRLRPDWVIMLNPGREILSAAAQQAGTEVRHLGCQCSNRRLLASISIVLAPTRILEKLQSDASDPEDRLRRGGKSSPRGCAQAKGRHPGQSARIR